jgi:hypothetical protein
MFQGSAAENRTGLGQLRGISARWRRRPEADQGAEPEVEGETDGLNHGLSEDELRALIAEDLRAFMRRPMARPPREGVSPDRPFLLDRLVFAAS